MNNQPAHTNEFMERAAGAFMTIRVSVKRWEGVKRSNKAAAIAEQGAGAEKGVVSASVKLLGTYHSHLKAVKAANAKVSTYLYDHALPSDIEGEYMFHVDQIPQVMTDLQRLKAEAEQVLSEFLPNYSRYVAAAKKQLADLRTDEMAGGRARRVEWPDEDEVRSRFEITISAPDFVPVADIARFKHLPVAQAAQWAEQAQVKVARRIENAREFILNNTREFMADIEGKLSKGELRYSPKREEKVRHLSTQLRHLVESWDNDPRLKALADLIDEKILPATADKDLKEKPIEQSKVRRAAKNVVKGIDAHHKDQARIRKQAAKTPATNKSATLTGTPVGGGMLADLV